MFLKTKNYVSRLKKCKLAARPPRGAPPAISAFPGRPPVKILMLLFVGGPLKSEEVASQGDLGDSETSLCEWGEGRSAAGRRGSLSCVPRGSSARRPGRRRHML